MKLDNNEESTPAEDGKREDVLDTNDKQENDDEGTNDVKLVAQPNVTAQVDDLHRNTTSSSTDVIDEVTTGVTPVQDVTVEAQQSTDKDDETSTAGAAPAITDDTADATTADATGSLGDVMQVSSGEKKLAAWEKSRRKKQLKKLRGKKLAQRGNFLRFLWG